MKNNPTTHQNKQDDWEKEFDEMFSGVEFNPPFIKHGTLSGEVKDFIASELSKARQKERERVLEEVEKKFKPYIRGFTIDGKTVKHDVIDVDEWEALKSKLLNSQ